MALLTVNGEGIFFTTPPSLTTNYSRQPSGGFSESASGVNQSWYGINLTYIDGFINPAGGFLTSITISDRGSVVWSLTDFSVQVTGVADLDSYIIKLLDQGVVIDVQGGEEMTIYQHFQPPLILTAFQASTQ